MKKRHLLYLLLSGTLLFTGGVLEAQNETIRISDTERLAVGPGPEDMVLDTLGKLHRLLISCRARREEYKPYGEIEALDLHTGERSVLSRMGEPDDIRFEPHGIYLEGDRLYVISHEKEPDYHPVLIYRVGLQELEFLERVHAPYMHSPNALVTGPSGEIYLVNDSGKRGSMMEKALKQKKASVVRLTKNAQGVWSPKVVAEKLGYPAGINRLDEQIYVGDALLHKIHTYTITPEGLEPAGEIGDLKGNDNLRIYRGHILTPGHVKPLRFIRHTRKVSRLSPVTVFLADPGTGEHQLLYETDGSQISGGSTALIYRDHLYISQIFEPYLLKVRL
jgi:hypothetical protein